MGENLPMTAQEQKTVEVPDTGGAVFAGAGHSQSIRLHQEPEDKALIPSLTPGEGQVRISGLSFLSCTAWLVLGLPSIFLHPEFWTNVMGSSLCDGDLSMKAVVMGL